MFLKFASREQGTVGEREQALLPLDLGNLSERGRIAEKKRGEVEEIFLTANRRFVGVTRWEDVDSYSPRYSQSKHQQ